MIDLANPIIYDLILKIMHHGRCGSTVHTSAGLCQMAGDADLVPAGDVALPQFLPLTLRSLTIKLINWFISAAGHTLIICPVPDPGLGN